MKDGTLKLVVYVGGLNFLAFIVIDVIIGGDALGGKVNHGHYYLNNHGSFTEVSHGVFVYSTYHAYLAMFGLLLAFAAARTLGRRNSN